MNIYLTSILLFLISFFCTTVYSQQAPQGWFIYFGNTKINKSKFSIHHELQLRDHQVFGDHNQTLFRLGLQYEVLPWLSITNGYGYIHSESRGEPNNPFRENRIYQEALAKQTAGRFMLRHRLRLEERFIEDQDFRGRGRYVFFADLPLTTLKMQENTIYASFYNEVFINLFQDDHIKTFDRNRLYVGAGYKIRNNLGMQLGYMRQHVGSSKGTNHILLSLHHQIN